MGDRLTWALIIGAASASLSAFVTGFFATRTSRITSVAAVRKVDLEERDSISKEQRELREAYKAQRDEERELNKKLRADIEALEEERKRLRSLLDEAEIEIDRLKSRF